MVYRKSPLSDISKIVAFDFTAINASLYAENLGVTGDLSWLERSRQQPAAFQGALVSYWDRLTAVSGRSVPPERYDLYYDLIERFKDKTAPALRWYEQGRGWQQLSYAELNQFAEALSEFWNDAGAKAGDVIAILYPFGRDWLVALLAGFRLGLVVSALPPQGRAFVARRLESLAPQWLAGERLFLRGLTPDWQALVLPDSSSAAPVKRYFGYSGGSTVALCFDPTATPVDQPRVVSIDSLYWGALRDGIVTLGLAPGLACAAPGWHLLETQPALMLSVLFCGACFVHFDMADLEQAPERLSEQKIDVLGVSPDLRELLRNRPIAVEKNWRFWFRHPAESGDLALWQDFVTRLQLNTVPSGNLIWNASLGGCVVFSVRRRGQAHNECFPAACLHFQVGNVAAPEQPAPGNSGLLALEIIQDGEAAWVVTPYLIATRGDACLYLGTYPGGRAGRVYPNAEVLGVLAQDAGYPALVEVPMGADDALRVLLAFGGKGNSETWLARIETELGAEFRPDRLECLPLLPKRDDEGAVDQAWCQKHYLSGELYRRQRKPIYRCLSELKQLILMS